MPGIIGSKQTESEGVAQRRGLFTNTHKSRAACAITIIYYPCFCGIIFHILIGSCRSVDSGIYTPEVVKRMFPKSYLVYSVNFLTCLLITYLVYSENYHVYLLITTRDKSEWRI